MTMAMLTKDTWQLTVHNVSNQTKANSLAIDTHDKLEYDNIILN